MYARVLTSEQQAAIDNAMVLLPFFGFAFFDPTKDEGRSVACAIRRRTFFLPKGVPRLVCQVITFVLLTSSKAADRLVGQQQEITKTIVELTQVSLQGATLEST
jgi:hypothetical protein